MKFLLFMHTHPAWEQLSPEAQDRVFRQHEAFLRELEERGACVAVYDPAGPEEARTVHRDAAGGFEVTKGPLAGAHDRLGGLYVIEAVSTEEALGWAQRGRFIEGANEIRPIPDTTA